MAGERDLEGDLPESARPEPRAAAGKGARSALEVRADLLDDVVCAELEASWASLRRARAVFEADRHNLEAAAGLGGVRREVERRSFLAQLALSLRVPEPRVHALLAQARMLFGHLPATVDRVAEGAIGYAQAVSIAEEAGPLPVDALARYDAEAAELAVGRTVPQLRRRLRGLRERLHPEPLQTRHAASFERRSVWTEPGSDGMGTLTACLPNADLAIIEARLDATARAMRFGPSAATEAGPLFRPDLASPEAREEAREEARTLAQLRADVLRDLLVSADARAGEAAGIPAVTTTVLLTVPALTLLGQSDTPATMEGVGPIDPATARRLVADAPGLYRVLTDPETGATLSFGRDSYRIPTALRRYLRLRDGSCTFPGCNRRTTACDIDHARDWARGGCTDADNLAHLCRGHHTLKHHGGWSAAPPQPPATGPRCGAPPPRPATPSRPATPRPDARRWRAPTGDHYDRPSESILPADAPF